MGFNIWSRTGNGEIYVSEIDAYGDIGGSFKFNTNNVTTTPIVEKTSYEPQLLGVSTPDAPSTVDKWSDYTAPTNEFYNVTQSDPLEPMISPSDPSGVINIPTDQGEIPDQVNAAPTKMQIPGIDEQTPEYVSGMLTPPQHQAMYKYFEELEEQGVTEIMIGDIEYKAFELNPDSPFYEDIYNFFKTGFSETQHSVDSKGNKYVTKAGTFLWAPTAEGPTFAYKTRQWQRNFIAKHDLPENYFESVHTKYGKDWLFGALKNREKWEEVIDFANKELGIVRKGEGKSYNLEMINGHYKLDPKDKDSTKLEPVITSSELGDQDVDPDAPVPVFNRYADLPWNTIYSDYLSNLPISSPEEYQFRSGQSNDLHTYFMLDANWDQPRTEGSGRMFGEIKETNPYAEFLSDFKTPTFGELTGDIGHVIDIIGTPLDEWSKIEFDDAKLEQGAYSAEEVKDYRLWERYKASPDADKNQYRLSSLPIMQHTPMALREETESILNRLYQRWLADPEREGGNYLEYVDKNNYFGMINPKRKDKEVLGGAELPVS